MLALWTLRKNSIELFPNKSTILLHTNSVDLFPPINKITVFVKYFRTDQWKLWRKLCECLWHRLQTMGFWFSLFAAESPGPWMRNLLCRWRRWSLCWKPLSPLLTLCSGLTWSVQPQNDRGNLLQQRHKSIRWAWLTLQSFVMKLSNTPN